MEQNSNRYKEGDSGNEGYLAERGEAGCRRGNQPFKKDERGIKMRKLLGLMAIVAALGMVFVAGPVLADDVETHDGTTMSGTVPFAASWELTEPDVTPFTTGATITAYDAGEIVVADLIQITDFDCNTKFKISASKGTRSLASSLT